jgi:hypothetical protein
VGAGGVSSGGACEYGRGHTGVGGVRVGGDKDRRCDGPGSMGWYKGVGTDMVVTSLGYEGDAAMLEDASVQRDDMCRPGRMRTQSAGGRG